MLLKDYQKEALDVVRQFHESVLTQPDGDPAMAYAAITRKLYNKLYSYNDCPAGRHIPYCCVRLPTGGGKTLLAAHSLAVIGDSYLQTDSPLALWLVPTKQILSQTLKALKNKAHPYHRAVREGLGEVNVCNIQEALGQDVGLDPHRPMVIVSTIQSFRVAEKEGRKVYDENGNLRSFFDGLPREAQQGLYLDDAGEVIPSLANLIAVRRPVVIVDEAHNSTTDLSYDVLRGLNPSTILELTATPNKQSNVIYAASAAQLKAEHMIKIPIFLETSQDWKDLMRDSIGLRSQLQVAAAREQQATGDYIRPIILFQAERKSQKKDTRDVEFIEKSLLQDFGVDPKEIAVSVGTRDELDGVDIESPACPIRYVITQSKLKEGWDCPSAYILVSLAEQQSRTAVEQILGRVLRMPGARRREEKELNKSYAFIHSKNFHDAAKALQDNLVKSGFDRYEAKNLVQQYGGTIELKTTDDRSGSLPTGLKDKAVVVEEDGRTVVLGTFDETEREQILQVYPEAQIQETGEGLVLIPKDETKSRTITVPRLSIRRNAKLSEFTTRAFSTTVWNPADYAIKIPAESFSVKSETITSAGEIDVTEEGQLTRKLKPVQEQMLLVARDDAWDAGRLSAWLTKKIPHPDVTAQVFRAWTSLLVQDQLNGQTNMAYLDRHKFRFRDAVKRLYEACQSEHYRKAWQSCLDGGDLVVEENYSFEFYEDGDYPMTRPYQGGMEFPKHLFEDVGDLEDGGEEHTCAELIEGHDNVETWVRNLPRPGMFYLQLPTRRFYPDFIAKLKDGRVAVIEYKGGHLATADEAQLKDIVGRAWAAASSGRCVFKMVADNDWESLNAVLAPA